MNPTDAARGLLKLLALPYGTVSILPWQDQGKMVMRVMIDRSYLNRASVPTTFEGYEVKIEQRNPALAH